MEKGVKSAYGLTDIILRIQSFTRLAPLIYKLIQKVILVRP